MKTLRYILLVLVILTCSVTAYGSSEISIGITLQSERQPVYIYRSVPVFQRVYTCAQPVYVCPQPFYVTPTPVCYAQPEFSLSFSWGSGGRSYYGGHRDSFSGGHRSYYDGGRGGGRNNGRGHR